jgi:thioredoxin-related protein
VIALKTLYFLVFSLFLLSGCSFGENLDKMNELKVVGQLKPSEENQYHMYTYFDFPDGRILAESEREKTEDENLQYQYEVYDTMNVKLQLEKLHTFGVRKKEHAQEEIEVLNIDTFPTFILLDNTGVLLQTSDMDEVDDYLRLIPSIEEIDK